MAVFRIPSIPPTTNKTIRFPNDVIEAVESCIQGKECTFSAYVVAAVRAALASTPAQEEAAQGEPAALRKGAPGSQLPAVADEDFAGVVIACDISPNKEWK